MKKALITGITGFAGGYLVSELLENGYEVNGTYLSDSGFDQFEQRDKVTLHKVDLLDKESTDKLIAEVKPDFMFHLAAMSSPKISFDKPGETLNNNISSQVNLLEAVKNHELLDTKILIISSAEIYGLVSDEDLPVDEDTPFKPASPYAVSKLAQDFLGLEYFLSSKLQIVRVRPFNHVGPRQSPDFVVSAFSKRIVDIERGIDSVMKVGNLTSKKDFTDVKDMVKAYRIALEQGEVGEVYNLGSGKAYEIAEILKMLASMAEVEVKVEEDPALLRPTDSREIICDFSKFNKLTGWTPQIPIEKTLQDTLDYWRKQ